MQSPREARELLDVELARRGRRWGDENEERLTTMRDELTQLRHRPRLRAIAMVKHFNGRTHLGAGDGCYMKSRGSIDYARAQQGVD